MPTPLRFACVALPLWLLWGMLVAAAAPKAPGGLAQAAFVASTLAALAGCVWAGWNAFPAMSGRTRRLACLALGVTLFTGIAYVGHLIGQTVAGPLAR